MFFRSESPARRVANAAILGASSVMIALTGVLSAGVPAMADGHTGNAEGAASEGSSANKGGVTIEIDGNTATFSQSNSNSAHPGKTGDDIPTKGVGRCDPAAESCTEELVPGQRRIVEVLEEVAYVCKWFDGLNCGTQEFMVTPYGNSPPLPYSWLYNNYCAANPSADPNYGQGGSGGAYTSINYGGNAIPVNRGGQWNVQASVLSEWVELREEQNFSYKFVESISIPNEDGTFTTQIRESALDLGWVFMGSTYSYRITGGCNTQPSPAIKLAKDCTTGMDVQVNGPYYQDWGQIPSVADGGTNTRTPFYRENGSETIGWEGPVWENSSVYGRSATNSGSISSYKAIGSKPDIESVWAGCVPGDNDTFEKIDSSDFDALGRYIAPTALYGNEADYYTLRHPRYTEIYRGLIANALKAGQSNSAAGPGFFVLTGIGPIGVENNNSYFKTICDSGTDNTLKTRMRVVAYFASGGRDAQPWNDGNEDYYSAECGGNTEGEETNKRTNDLLQCKDFDPTIPLVDGKPAVPFQNKPTRFAPSQDNGSDDANNNPAIIQLKQEGDKYIAPATADPIFAQWQRPVIETRSGDNVNDDRNAKNVVWEFKYELDSDSSPMLKGTNVNDRNQPYHGWLVTKGNSADEVLLGDKNGIYATREWTPNKDYDFGILEPKYEYKPYTYSYTYEYRNYTYRSETYQSGTRTYGCGSYSYQCGSESYGCGSYCTNRTHWGGATYYWWANGGRGGWLCPGGWSLHGTSCAITVCDVWHTRWCSRPRYCTGTHYCTAPVYSTRSIKNPPPAQFYDNGSRYQKDIPNLDPPPAGWEDNGSSYQRKLPPPSGYSDIGGAGNGYQSNVGGTVGMEFNKWNGWYDETVLDTCTIVMSDYNPALTTQYNIKCGDEFTNGKGAVTNQTRGAIFRFFQSSSADSDGWTVTPKWRVTADILTDGTDTVGFQPTADGSLVPLYADIGGTYKRMSYVCSGEPLTIDVERIASN